MKITIISIATILSLMSCGGKSGSEEEHGHDHGGGGGPEGSSVVLSPDQMMSLKLELDSIHQRTLSDIFRFTGVISVPPQHKADIASPAEGIVQSITVTEGQNVTKGQTLVTLSHPSFIDLQQSYLESKAQLPYTEAEYNRQRTLSSENISSKKSFQEAEANFNVLQARMNALAIQLQLLGINASTLSHSNLSGLVSIKSPLNGTVSHIGVTLGSSVHAATTILSVVDNSAAVLEISVFEQDISRVMINQDVSFTLTNTPSKTYTAKVSNVGSTFENESKAVKVRATIIGERMGLIDGMNTNVVLSGSGKTVPSVKDAAIVNHQGVDYIFVYSEEAQEELLHGGHEEEEGHHHEGGEEQHPDEHAGEEPAAGSIAFQKIPVKRGASAGGFT